MARVWCRAGLCLSLVCLGNCEFSKYAAGQTADAPELIKVFVDATAKHHSAVSPDVSQLAASIDGKPAQVLSARSAKDDKLLFAVMVDISSSGRQQRDALNDAAVKIFQALTDQHSLGYLVLFNTQIYPSKRPLLPSEARTLLENSSFGGGTSLYDSVAQVATGILSRSANPDTPRRVIVVLSDGRDNFSKVTSAAMEHSLQQEGVSVFSLTKDASDTQSKAADFLLSDLMQSTGGKAAIHEDMLDGVPELLAAIRGQVELTIAAPQTPTGELHSLSVKTSEKGITITAPTQILIP